MFRRAWIPVLTILVLFHACPLPAQESADPAALRTTYALQARLAEDVGAARHAAAARLLELAEEIIALRGRAGRLAERLNEAERAAETLASLAEEHRGAARAAGMTRSRLVRALEARAAAIAERIAAADPDRRADLRRQAEALNAEIEALRDPATTGELPDPLESATATLVALAGVVEEEHRRLAAREVVEEELRVFLGGLRLFDEMSMPPSARADGGGSGPGCPPSACPISGGAPGDVPLTHSQPGAVGDDRPATLTAASLARLHARIAAYIGGAAPDPLPAVQGATVRRHASMGAGVLQFRDEGAAASRLGPKVGASLVYAPRPGGTLQLTIEPWLGGRALRTGFPAGAELAAEVREHLTGPLLGTWRWELTSWQKGRLVPEPPTPPVYLEPGRLELGLAARVGVPVYGPLEIELGGGGDAVRYDPEDWKVLNRQGANGSLALVSRGERASARLAARASRHGFPRGADGVEREDTRLGLELDGSLEGRVVLRVSAGVSRNDSRLPAYDFQSWRGALVLSTSLGPGAIKTYAAVAQQRYQDPGSPDQRVAPSDRDSGAVLALQYSLPMGPSNTLALRGDWSRSQTGFRDDFYERFGLSVEWTFRGR
ncbi:MAG: hypothetical protein ACOCVZ_03910 [Gemmatimonadota bacterium]